MNENIFYGSNYPKELEALIIKEGVLFYEY